MVVAGVVVVGVVIVVVVVGGVVVFEAVSNTVPCPLQDTG